MTTKARQTRLALLLGVLVALFTATIFAVGVGILNGTPLLLQNILAMSVLGLILGSIAFLFLFFRLYYALGIYAAGLVLGSAVMISTFLKGVAGWEDLIGLLSYLLLVGMGLALGLLVQLIVYLVQRNKKAKEGGQAP
ncbi:MAG TPA: hypothetical protein GX720_00710 [Clostridiaceae bacterium]|nr:hypothetical protein [Clostridiaceae bacterium]